MPRLCKNNMNGRTPSTVRIFNAFARELVLVCKKHCSAEHKASLKKSFKLFDASSPKYAKSFIERQKADGASPEDPVVFQAVSLDMIKRAVPKDMHDLVDALVSGMIVSSSLLEAEASEALVHKVSDAILAKDPSLAEDSILDDDLATSLKSVCDGALPERLLDDLRATLRHRAESAAVAEHTETDQALGIVGLAEEISRELDVASLMTGMPSGGGDAGLQTIIESINRKVQDRIQDGSVDPARLCSEAQSILGTMSPP